MYVFDTHPILYLHLLTAVKKPKHVLTGGSHFAAKFRSSSEYAQLHDSLDPIIQTALRRPVVECPSYATNYFWQVI